MSVLINMEMPTRCGDCPIRPDTEWDVTCDPEYRESHFDTDEWGQ